MLSVGRGLVGLGLDRGCGCCVHRGVCGLVCVVGVVDDVGVLVFPHAERKNDEQVTDGNQDCTCRE